MARGRGNRKRAAQLQHARTVRAQKMQERKSAEASSGSNEEEDGADDAAPPPAKHMKTAQKKVSGKRKESTSAPIPSLPPLSQFSVDRVLMDDPSTKTMAVAGHFPRKPSLTAVVMAEKTPLSRDNLTQVFTKGTKFTTSTSNSVYGQVMAEGGGSVGDLKLLTVYPATEAHIAKYTRQVCHVIHETPRDYETITRPFIGSQSFDIQWVYNILEGREEQERIIYQDPDPDTGFVLLPDFKWDQRDLQNLYLLAICRRRDILSLRELRGQHLPLLKNVLDKGTEAVSSKYGVPRDQLRVYIHYQPSYYHLHVHITRLSYAAPKTSVGQAHLLHDVISNIETIDPGYYQKCVLSFTAGESGLLWKAYKNHAARN